MLLVALALVLLGGVWTGRLLGGETASPAAGSPPTGGPDPRSGTLNVLLGGDLLLDLEPAAILAAEGPTALMRGWVDLRWADDVDLGLVNLECALTAEGEPLAGKSFVFRGEPDRSADCLKWVGVDGVSLANNHTLDFGPAGLLWTIESLRENDIAYAGAGGDAAEAFAPAWFERNGLKVAFLAFGGEAYVSERYREMWVATANDPGVAPLAPRADLLAAIAAARREADVVIVSFHWGLEYHDFVPAQQDLGRAAIDAGADVVFGHHPHVPQPVELYRGRPIFYSLGNLVFHPFQPRARRMMAGLVRLGPDDDGRTVPWAVEVYPLYNEGGRTITMPAGQSADFLAEMARRSAPLGTEFQVLQDRLVADLLH